jgi:hypothetical protein
MKLTRKVINTIKATISQPNLRAFSTFNAYKNDKIS